MSNAHSIIITLLVIYGFPCKLSEHTSQWGFPVLINIKPRPEMEYLYFNNIGDNSFVYPIVLEEEIEGEVILGLLNYKGSAIPELRLPHTNDNLAFNVKLRLEEVVEGNKWYLVIENRQDFESDYVDYLHMSLHIITDTKRPVITLQIKNIDDNPPVITGKTCQVPAFFTGLTNCTYSVTDADGINDFGQPNFFVVPRTQEEDTLFGIEILGYNHPTSNEKDTFEIGLTVLKELNYDEERIYVFPIAAIDSAFNQGRFTAVIQVLN